MVSKQKTLLLVALLFVLPAVVVLTLFQSNAGPDFIDGAQKGGIVRGRVALADGAPAPDVSVVASKVTSNVIGGELARTRSDVDGAFSVTLPPTEGRYVLHFSGPLLLDQLVEFGWLTRDGSAAKDDAIAVEMRLGCSLEVEIVGADKQPAGSGEYELSGATSAGLLGGFARGNVARSGKFESGKFSVDGLPSMSARVQIRLVSGERVDSVLDLTEGANRHKVEL